MMTRALSGSSCNRVAANGDGTHECTRQRVLRVVHFGQGKVEGERRFRALVFVDPIAVQPVAAAAGAGIIERKAEIVAAQEPLEGAPGLDQPCGILRDAKRFQAGGNHGLGLHRLLIEVRARAVADVKAVAADGPEVARLCPLQRGQPAQATSSRFPRLRLRAFATAQYQGLAETGVVVGDARFKPGPVLRGAASARASPACR